MRKLIAFLWLQFAIGIFPLVWDERCKAACLRYILKRNFR